VPVLICAGIFVWLRTSLPFLTFLNARIQTAPQTLAPDYRIEFSEIKVAASGRHLIPGVQVNDIRVYCGETALLICPELFASFHLFGMMSGQFAMHMKQRLPELLHRELIHSGIISEDMSYVATLLAVIGIEGE